MPENRGTFIRYKGNEIVQLQNDGELTLLTKGSYMEDDIEVEVNRAETLVSKTVTQNGAYDPEDDDADGYSGVTVNVPNTYAAGDEGKVVSNGELVAQGSHTITENGTYDTTLVSELTADIAGGGGVKNILSGTNAPSPSLGSDGDIYLLHKKTKDAVLSYLRTNNINLNVSLSNWTYRTSDKIVLKYKNVGAHGGLWGQFLNVANYQQLLLQYNLYNGRQCMNLYHGGAYSGDGAYWFAGPSDTTKYFAVILDGSDFSIRSGAGRDNYTAIEVSASLGTESDTDVSSPVFNAEGTNTLNIEFHELEVYRDGVLIHDYLPIQGGIVDVVDDVGFPIMSQSVTYGTSYTMAKTVYGAYCKVNGSWQALEGTDVDDVNTGGGITI